MINKANMVSDFLKQFFGAKLPIQAFNTRNFVGDPMTTIFNVNGIQIDWCRKYDYIEIFGLNLDEWNYLIEMDCVC